ncbi:MAG: hypothetical protein ACREVQ_13450 [Burkholderiales bacterium]
MRALVLSLLAAASLSCAAAPFAVRLGDGRIVLNPPAGFADTLDLASPRLLELAESLTSASNRILLFALTDADLRRFGLGDSPELRRYVMVATPRAAERDNLGLSQFRTYADDAVRALGKPSEPSDLRAFLDKQPPGRAMLLRELQRETLSVSLLAGTRLPAEHGDPVEYLLYTTTQLLLRGKIVSVSVYTRYSTDADLEWLLEETRRWTGELSSLNLR